MSSRGSGCLFRPRPHARASSTACCDGSSVYRQAGGRGCPFGTMGADARMARDVLAGLTDIEQLAPRTALLVRFDVEPMPSRLGASRPGASENDEERVSHARSQRHGASDKVSLGGARLLGNVRVSKLGLRLDHASLYRSRGAIMFGSPRDAHTSPLLLRHARWRGRRRVVELRLLPGAAAA